MSMLCLGAASGIGAATSVVFAKHGAKLALTDKNSLDDTKKKCHDVGLADEKVKSSVCLFWLYVAIL